MTRVRRAAQRSSLGMLVLFELFEGPQHAYRIHKLLQQQGKDRVVNVRSRTSLYQTIERLERLGLVEVSETSRAEGYPERVIYAITDAGRETAREWLREMLRETGDEFPEFIAAVSVLFALAPDDARQQLEERAERLQAELAATESELARARAGLPRLFLLEEEYRQALLGAELAWVRSVVEDLLAGRLIWSDEWLREISAAFIPPDDEAKPGDQEG
jgi:DNA-binding PadR family transcriptional regulator